MKTLKLLSFLFLSLALFSCKSDYGKIIKAKRQFLNAGVENAPNHLKYTVEFEILKPVVIEQIKIRNKKQEKIISHYIIKDLKTSQMATNLKNLSKGHYILTASLPLKQSEKIAKKEILDIKIKLPHKSKKYHLKYKIKTFQTVFMR
ncbi:MAG TPA: hypothetical protein ENK64_00325 [Flavobacteriales bacterium]|nr:hypothetical protein [Flavobacteriales bacterium]